MSEYPKYFNEISPESISTNDEIHSGLKWTIEYNSTIGQVNFDNYSKYTAIHTDNRPSYYAVLSDNNNQYARIPVYSYTYTETISVKGRNNPNNYNVFYPYPNANTRWGATIDVADIVPKHYAWNNKNYITTYSGYNYTVELIKNYKGNNEQSYNLFNGTNNYINYSNNLNSIISVFANRSENDGININKDVLRIGVTYTYLNNGIIYNGETTNDNEQIVYLWKAKPSRSSYIYRYVVNSDNPGGILYSRYKKDSTNNNYDLLHPEVFSLENDWDKAINLNDDNKVEIITHESLSENDKQKLRDSLTEIYSYYGGGASANQSLSMIPKNCSGDQTQYSLKTYVGVRKIQSGITNNYISFPDDYVFSTVNLTTHGTDLNDDDYNYDIYPAVISLYNFINTNSGPGHLYNVCRNPNYNYRYESLGIILRSYSYILENNYVDKNNTSIDMIGGINDTLCQIYPGKFYDASLTTYHDTLISVPFNVYKKEAITINGTNKNVTTYIIRLIINNGSNYDIVLNTANIGKINLKYSNGDGSYYESVTDISFNNCGVYIGDNSNVYSNFSQLGVYNIGIPAQGSNFQDINIINGYVVKSGHIIFDSLSAAYSRKFKISLQFNHDKMFFGKPGELSNIKLNASIMDVDIKLYNSFGGNPRITEKTIELQQGKRLKYNVLNDAYKYPYYHYHCEPAQVPMDDTTGTTYVPGPDENNTIEITDSAIISYLMKNGISKKEPGYYYNDNIHHYSFDDLFYTDFIPQLDGTTSYILIDVLVTVDATDNTNPHVIIDN